MYKRCVNVLWFALYSCLDYGKIMLVAKLLGSRISQQTRLLCFYY